jgi:hemerythrin-like domain-containing protein
MEATELLMQDHKAVQKLFKDFEKLSEKGSEKELSSLAQQICMELKTHTAIEEEIFYPAMRQATEASDMVSEAEVEHATAKSLISQIEKCDPSDEKYCALVTVLGEYVNHHIQEEEKEMFPQARKSDLDLDALGDEMQQKKQKLMKKNSH